MGVVLQAQQYVVGWGTLALTFVLVAFFDKLWPPDIAGPSGV
jgi:hypothetical protein